MYLKLLVILQLRELGLLSYNCMLRNSIFFLLLFWGSIIWSQSDSINHNLKKDFWIKRSNEIGCFVTTLYDFDKFPLLLYGKKNFNLIVNTGNGIGYKRFLKSNYFLSFGYTNFYGSNLTPTVFGTVYYKRADIYLIGFGKRMYKNRWVDLSPEIQFLYRKGVTLSYEDVVVQDVGIAHVISYWGATGGFDFNFKLFNFFSLFVKSYYVQYFKVKETYTNSPFKTNYSNKSIIVNIGFRALF
jgi:hypothetical protein